MIVVIDTNVWISALQFAGNNGVPIRVVDTVLRWHIVATCLQIREELSRVLDEKFGWPEDKIGSYLNRYFNGSTEVSVFGNIRVCRDPDDNMVLECAINSGAEVIVTGDKDLLALDQYQNVRIMTPADFLKL